MNLEQRIDAELYEWENIIEEIIGANEASTEHAENIATLRVDIALVFCTLRDTKDYLDECLHRGTRSTDTEDRLSDRIGVLLSQGLQERGEET